MVSDNDRKRPVLKDWTLQEPRQQTNDPLIIHFNEYMDAMLDEAVLHIMPVDNDDRVHGTYTLFNQEQSLQFTPKKPWKAGRYTIIVTRYLEDLAGNSSIRLFEAGVQDSEDMKHEKFIDVKSFEVD